MNDQWSGNTFRRFFATNEPGSSRSSTPSTNRLTTIRRPPPASRSCRRQVPEARTDGRVEVPGRSQRPVLADLDRQLGERLGRGAVDRARPVEDVERRLVAGAPQLVLLRQVQADRAARVRADLRVA